MSTGTITSGPAVAPWETYVGDANEETFEFLSGNDPQDITGAIITAQARAAASDPTPAIDAVCTVTDGPKGLATVAWDGELLRTLVGNEDQWVGVYDMQILELGKTLPRTVLRGKFTAILDVTRP